MNTIYFLFVRQSDDLIGPPTRRLWKAMRSCRARSHRLRRRAAEANLPTPAPPARRSRARYGAQLVVDKCKKRLCAMPPAKSKKTMIAQGYYSYRSGLEAGEQLLSGRKIPTAIDVIARNIHGLGNGGKAKPHNYLVPHSLIERESSAPPPQAHREV